MVKEKYMTRGELQPLQLVYINWNSSVQYNNSAFNWEVAQIYSALTITLGSRGQEGKT
jgi:hypothetical protein